MKRAILFAVLTMVGCAAPKPLRSTFSHIGKVAYLLPGQDIQAAMNEGYTTIELAGGTYPGPRFIYNDVTITCQAYGACVLDYKHGDGPTIYVKQ